MPWTETCAVEQRIAFIRDVLRGEISKAELCRRYGISRPTGDKWLGRFEEQGLDGMEDLPSVPRCHPNQVDEQRALMVLSLRRAHMTWGPRKLKAYLERRYPEMVWPATSTFGEILRRHGMAASRRRCQRTPPYTQPFAGCGEPNSLWCADFKGNFRTQDGIRCYPLTITDAFSRYLLKCQGMKKAWTTPAKAVFDAAVREYGLPLAIRTDNGAPFASKAVGGLSRLSVWWLKMGILPERIEPGEPQQNGRHERMHLTLKQETASPPQATPRAQQRRFDAFRQEFNQQRPHEALAQRTPADLYQASVRPYPNRPREPEYSDNMLVRYVRINGEIKWHSRRIYLGELLAGENVGLWPITDGYWVVYFFDLPLCVLDERRRKMWHLDKALRRPWWPESLVLPSPSAALQGLGKTLSCK